MRLFHKLVAAMFAVTALVLTINVAVSRMSIGGGFADFLYQQERTLVEEALPEIAAIYQRDSSWDRLRRDPYLLHGLFSRSGDEGRRRRGPPRRGPGPRPRGGPEDSRSPPPRELSFRVYLMDSDRVPVLGPRTPSGSIGSDPFPIEVNGEVVGWVGVVPQVGPLTKAQQNFVDKQQAILLWSLLAGLVAAGLLAWLLSRHLTRPVAAVASAIRSLTKGNFERKFEPDGKDEIAELGRDVNLLADRLAANESSRRRWTADTAHELRTPLAVLQAELEAILDGIRQPDSGAIESLLAETRHLSALVNDLHHLTLADTGALDYRMERLDWRDLVNEATGLFADRADRVELTLTAGLPATPVWIKGDPTRIRQLLTNLLENAIRYTAGGGTIEINLTVDGQLTVDDSPPGVEKGHEDELFDRFYRAESSRNRSSGGSGLGLAICRSIVEAHSGAIKAHGSRLGGVQISVLLPVID